MKLHLSITDSQFSNINWIESLLSRIVLQYYEVYDFFLFIVRRYQGNIINLLQYYRLNLCN